ncbi:hypothetical protein SLE2022_329480 [Rubroshorea leprosula]
MTLDVRMLKQRPKQKVGKEIEHGYGGDGVIVKGKKKMKASPSTAVQESSQLTSPAEKSRTAETEERIWARHNYDIYVFKN